jgi:hypothetical protein
MLPAGRGLDVRPHPHIGLATVTYLFDGEILHRDSLGNAQPIRPGAVNWMTVSSSAERIEQAKADWKAGRFGKVPGDEAEFIPLPEESPRPVNYP